ncbi:MAG: glycosyltransferase family 2 protein [Ignavibacteria bacterium]|nr:glycosyltransferase family 2 protein [Ignavibacteria bacterium]
MISIITPTLNSAKYLRQTILSIKSQCTNYDIEHIVVDGGSTDETKVIVVREGISKFFLLNGSSMYEAIDFGFRQSSGKILCWLNSDDLFVPDTVNIVCDYFSQNEKTEIITGSTIYINDLGNDLYKYKFSKVPENIFRSFGTLFLCQPSTFWRRETYLNTGGLNLSYKITADRDFIFRATEKNKLEYVNHVLSKFRFHGENLSKTKAQLAKEENDLINKKLGVGPTTVVKKIFSIAGHLYIKANNPAMIFWKLRNLSKL